MSERTLILLIVIVGCIVCTLINIAGRIVTKKDDNDYYELLDDYLNLKKELDKQREPVKNDISNTNE